MNIKSFVISVDRENEERRKFVTKIFNGAGLEFDFFSATDGQQIDHEWILQNVASERREMYYSGKYHWLTKGQLGCADSHRRLALQLLDDDQADAYLIFEDDVSLKKSFFKNQCLGKIISEYSLALLAHSLKIKSLPKAKSSLYGGYKLHEFPSGGVQTASAYIINKAGAKMIVDYQYPKIRAGADNWDWFVEGRQDQCVIVWPRPVTTGFFESSIRGMGLKRRMLIKALRFKPIQWLYSERQRRRL